LKRPGWEYASRFGVPVNAFVEVAVFVAGRGELGVVRARFEGLATNVIANMTASAQLNTNGNK